VADQAAIVEGYLDVIALHQAGYENVVSPMGTALTEDQLRLLKRSTRRIVLALDPDVAGQKAVLRGLDAARSAMDREGELGFDARGLLRNEARLQADLRVASMPDDLDPDEIVARDRDEWKQLIENAKPIVTHVMDSLAQGQNLNDAKIKNQIAAQVLPLIEDLPSPLERDTYRQALARMLRVDEGSLTGTQLPGPPVKRRPRGGGQSPQSQTMPAVAVNPTLKMESYCIGVLFHKPALLYRLDRKLQEFGLTPLAAEDFEYTDHQLMFGVIRMAVEQDEKDHHHYVMTHLPETISVVSRDLLIQSENLDDRVENKVFEELISLIIDLRRMNAMTHNIQLRFLLEEEQDGVNKRMYQEQVSQLAKLIYSLDQAKRKLSSKRQM
jgi:DNA primase